MTTPTARHPFVDPVSGREVALLIDPVLFWGDGGVGVEHPDCARLADVALDLDSFYCPRCGWSGRVSGSWVWDRFEAAR